ncbi:hypothetical protein EAO76_43655 [Streptomyces sp. sk2.1]|nr:hypothetical protein EAO76_43655 [Streptomyces sp. sk2.1]
MGDARHLSPSVQEVLRLVTPARIAPVGREIVLNFVSDTTLGLPKSSRPPPAPAAGRIRAVQVSRHHRGLSRW